MPEPMAELRCGSMQPHDAHTHILSRTPWVATCPGVKEDER